MEPQLAELLSDDMVEEYNKKLDKLIQKCIKKYKLNPEDCILIEPMTFSGKYYIVPKKFSKIKNGEHIDLSNAYCVGEIKMN